MILTDDFSTDPSSRWSTIFGTAPTWDSTNLELDCDTTADFIHRYTANDPGNLGHECQVTFILGSVRCFGPAVRMANDGGNDDCYAAYWDTGNSVVIARFDNGVRTVLNALSLTAASGDWVTLRLRAEASGSDTLLTVYGVNHGTTKPSSAPAWETTSLGTATDPAASDHAAARHGSCGIGGRPGASDYDTRHDFWTARINDEVGGGGETITMDKWLGRQEVRRRPHAAMVPSGFIPPDRND